MRSHEMNLQRFNKDILRFLHGKYSLLLYKRIWRINMKKIIGFVVVLMAAVMLFAGGKKDSRNEEITVISREDGSGTRGAFIELLGVEQKDSSGKKVDYTTDTASISNSTSVVMTSVAQNTSAIGYISLGSLNNTVKALVIDGADDYITKPFGMMELVARVKAVLRRSAVDQVKIRRLSNGSIQMDVNSHMLTVQEQPVELTRKEFELLRLFMENTNIVFTREIILDRIWGYDFDGETRTVDVHIRTLRQKLAEKDSMCETCIETVRGIGYRMPAQ